MPQCACALQTEVPTSMKPMRLTGLFSYLLVTPEANTAVGCGNPLLRVACRSSERQRFLPPLPALTMPLTATAAVVELKAASEFDDLVASGQTFLVDFFAVWCGPCVAIAPKLEKLAEDSAGKAIKFVKVDVDKLSELSQRLSISAMPTFQLYKNGVMVEEIVGADYSKIASVVANAI